MYKRSEQRAPDPDNPRLLYLRCDEYMYIVTLMFMSQRLGFARMETCMGEITDITLNH